MRVGVAWYAAAEWQRLREIADDPEQLEETHAEWERLAQQMMEDMAARGMLLERVDVRIDDLEAWCREQGQPVDANARAAYATELLRRKDDGIDR